MAVLVVNPKPETRNFSKDQGAASEMGRAALVFLVGWEAGWWLAGVRPVSPGGLKDMLERREGGRPHLIDVRTAAEFHWLHIPGAVNHPDLLSNPGVFSSQSKEDHLVLVCLSGHRAPVVAYRLKKLGYENLSYLSWGMLAWMLSGGKTVGGEGGR
jgi:rhodanese-related sulfurtransferase